MAHACEPKPFHQDSFDALCTSTELIFNEDNNKPYSMIHLINDMCRLGKEASEEKIRQCVERFIKDTEKQVVDCCFDSVKEYLIWLLHQHLMYYSDWKCAEEDIVEFLDHTTVECIRVKNVGCCYSAFKLTFKSQAYVGSLFKELWTLLADSSLGQSFANRPLTVQDMKSIIHFFKENFENTQTAVDIVDLFVSSCKELEEYTLREFVRGRPLANIFNICCQHKLSHYKHCLEDLSLC